MSREEKEKRLLLLVAAFQDREDPNDVRLADTLGRSGRCILQEASKIVGHPINSGRRTASLTVGELFALAA